MQIYNSLSQKIEEFVPLEKGKIVLYVCGLTPYDHTHIGHVRTYIAFDIIKRYLKMKYHVYHIQNITDVDDKIINRCKETNQDPKELTENIHNEALDLFDAVGIERADVYPKVTEHIPQIIEMIQRIMQNGHAYETKTGVYFDVSSFENYGQLSGQDLEKVKSGSRFEPDETKKSPEDFALWKKTNGEIIEFDSPFGKGRPGWHIECSAMALHYAKRTLDIHGGARDLIFPHHENEIAQSEAGTKKQFIKYWAHTGFLTVNGEKMSKSLGNFITLKDALERFTPNELRMFFIQSHYRSPVDYDEEKIKAAGEAVKRIFNSLELLKEKIDIESNEKDGKFRKETDDLIKKFYEHMDDDFNTPQALAVLFELLHSINKQEKNDFDQFKKLQEELQKIIDIFGLKKEDENLGNKLDDIVNVQGWLTKNLGVVRWKHIPSKNKTEEAEIELRQIIELRDRLRKEKKYREADIVRDKLGEIGIIIEDKEGKTKWSIKG
ncbi:MAG TPA: cysteine--tRNA ligase [Candidatus Bilamarchaeaceae archaeon]|nr:cysteine--tRNA ligase [Candidatus Bilamarchaeaceae archaeon]